MRYVKAFLMVYAVVSLLLIAIWAIDEAFM
jgi:preprotein translocase subunit SecE